MKNKTIVAVIAVIAMFLVGFVPQYVRVNRLENELRQSRQEAAGDELRDLIGFAYVQASQKNHGLAAETSSRLFNPVREAAKQTQDANRRKGLEDLLVLRDSVTAALAKGGAAMMGDLQQLFVTARQVTRSSCEPQIERFGPGERRSSRWNYLAEKHIGFCPAASAICFSNTKRPLAVNQSSTEFSPGSTQVV